MSEIINLPGNFMGKEDREKLESLGGHTIAHGRATRWHWETDANGGDVFEIYRGGKDQVLAARISRDRELDSFSARDAAGRSIVYGSLEQVFTALETHFKRLHGEVPDPPEPAA